MALLQIALCLALQFVINKVYYKLRRYYKSPGLLKAGSCPLSGYFCDFCDGTIFGFVCVEVLRPSQPNGVMSSAVSLPNHTFTGQA